MIGYGQLELRSRRVLGGSLAYRSAGVMYAVIPNFLGMRKAKEIITETTFEPFSHTHNCRVFAVPKLLSGHLKTHLKYWMSKLSEESS